VLGPYTYCLWLACSLLEAGVVVCALKQGAFRRYLALNLWMLLELLSGLTRFYVLSTHGLQSSEYAFFYYYSEALVIIGLYFALASLYVRVLEELKAESYVRLGATLLLSGTAIFSYLIVRQSSHLMLTHFVVELSQNLYFVGLVLTYVLWGAILKLRETRTRLIQFVLSLGVLFSMFAANYALRNLYPDLRWLWSSLPPLFDCFLPLAWCYTFMRVPEEARLVPGRLAAVPR
jgi:hypothetical protein